MSFFLELKRRNVFRVGAAYAVLAWLLIQVIDTVLPAFGVPGWIVPTLMFIVIMGFPIAVFLSWAYELTPEGIRHTVSIEDSDLISSAREDKRIPLVTILISFVLVYVCVDQYYLEELNTNLRENNIEGIDGDNVMRLPNSIAILPFDNSAPDLDSTSFAAGIYEEVLNHLVKRRDLNVITPTSLQEYKNDTRPITKIGEELNVESIMDGSVRFADGRVAVTARLIDAKTGVHLWSERYNREYTNIFGIQDDIAANIATALDTKLKSTLDPVYGIAQRVKGLTYLREGRVEEARLSIDRAINSALQ